MEKVCELLENLSNYISKDIGVLDSSANSASLRGVCTSLLIFLYDNQQPNLKKYVKPLGILLNFLYICSK